MADQSASQATGLPDFDTHAVLAKLRGQGDDAEAAMKQAYRIVFANELGRLVLADIAAQAGVGRRFGSPELTPHTLAYHQGGHDVACEILDRAGFDPASAVLMTMTGHLEGRDDERSSHADDEHVAHLDDAPD
jgi:hypothetical protein